MRALSRLLRSALCLALATAAGAQVTGSPAADSAARARSAWAAAVAASRNNDTAAARREVERAAAAWPTQQVYVWNRAVLAARQNDTTVVERALRDYARLGLGRDLSDSIFARYRGLPWFASVAAQHDANRAVMARSHVRATLSDSLLWPEGVDFDPRTGRFYVASIRRRTIVEVAPNGAERELWPRARPGIGAVLGVRVDPRRNVLWATLASVRQMDGFTPADTAIAALVEVRLSDGSILRRWDLPPSKHHTLGDVAIGPRGDVLFTDSDDPVLYRLRPNADAPEALRHPLFRSLQGIAPAPGGRIAYVADYSHGLLRVDLDAGTVTRLNDPGNSTTLGCDGIVLYRNSIIAVQNGVNPARIMRFRLDRAGQRLISAEVLDRNWPIADEPTIGTIVGDEFVYVANSQSNRYRADGSRTGQPLTRPALLALPLSR